MADRDDNFLSRWSRRKVESGQGLRRRAPSFETDKALAEEPDEYIRHVKSQEGEASPATVARDGENPVSVPDPDPDSDKASSKDTKPLSESDFDDVDFDKLNYGSDYTRFMEKGVPDAVRKRALRKLWSSNPILANIDGLNDYDEDFTDAALAIKIVGSNYKPGSGYLTEEERLASYHDGGESERQEKEAAEREASDPEDLDVEDMDNLDDEEDIGSEQDVAGAEDHESEPADDDEKA